MTTDHDIRIDIPDRVDMELCHRLVELQREIWGLTDLDTMPPWRLFVTPRIGNILAVGLDGPKPVAFALLTRAVAVESSQPYLYMDMFGVSPPYQGRGIGERMMKRLQVHARPLGFDSIRWTYDPLEGANAKLYIGKLGASVRKYHVDYYGPLSGIRGGSPTDRFWAELDTDAKPSATLSAPLAVRMTDYDRYETIMESGPAHLSVEIPRAFGPMKTDDPQQAEGIRLATRRIFCDLFEKGYAVRGFRDDGEQNFYLVSRQQPPTS